MVFKERWSVKMLALFALVFTKIRDFFIGRKKTFPKRLGKHNDLRSYD